MAAVALGGDLEQRARSSPTPGEREMFKVPLFGGDLSLQQRMIFSASSNTSSRWSSEAAKLLLGIVNASPESGTRPELQEASSFGENHNFKAPGSVPFKWEEQPGKPKSPSTTSCSDFSLSSSPRSSSLSPPPCLLIDPTRGSPQQQGLSPRLAERIKNILQLRLMTSPLRSPISWSLSKDSNSAGEMRSSPVSILDSRAFGTSPESYSSSPTGKRRSSSSSSRSNFLEQQAVESPLSSGRFKKQLSLEIWDRSLRESSSASSGCGFFKSMLGCWKLQHKLIDHDDTNRSTSLENYIEHPQAFCSDHVLGGEFESFKERSYDEVADCARFDDQSDCFYDEAEALEMAEAEIKQPADEVHAVNDGDFATFPVSAAFVFSKPALKKTGVVAERKKTSQRSKRVRFLIEDYSSDEDDDAGGDSRAKNSNKDVDDLFDDAISTDDEGFQRPVRSVIRRRKKNLINSSSSISSSKLSPIASSPGAADQAAITRYSSFDKASRETFHAIANFDLDAADSSPDLQPMQNVDQRPPYGSVLRFR